MMGKLWTKVGVVLVGGFLLGSGMLGGRVVQAHTPDTPTCSGLPTDTDFFSETDETASIVIGALTPDLVTQQGTGSAANGGNTKYRYAKITVPQLAAGELRVFDTRDPTESATLNAASDAVLCHGTSIRAQYRTSHPSSHLNAENARTSALSNQMRASDAADKASDANDAANIQEVREATALDTSGPDGTPDGKLDDHDATDSNSNGSIDTDERAPITAARDVISNALRTARDALSTARDALSTARSNLATAARALNAASTNLVGQAKTDAEAAAGEAAADEQAALEAYNDPTNQLPPSSQPDITELAAVREALVDATNTPPGVSNALTTAASNLGTAAINLRTAANALHDTEAESELFQLRAEVRPGDQEYILVTTGQETVDEPDLVVQFHGAIADASLRRNRSFTRGNQDTVPITITAPGLLTVETTGSTDTKGMLDDSTGAEVAYAESGGSGGNFKMFVPVVLDAADPASTTAATYNVVVEGQTLDTAGEYALGMEFKVAMPTTGSTDAPVHPSGNPWSATTTVAADDTTPQIKKIAEDGNTADEDYFLFIPITSGFLTVNANDDNTAAPDSNTEGTLYGAMGEGPTGEMRVGEIATDADSGPGSHFEFSVPVEANKNYLVKVEGTNGQYFLGFHHDPVPTAQTVTSTAPTARYLITNEDGTRKTNYGDGALCAQTGNRSNEICDSTGDQHKDRYLLNIAESGTLYVHSTGTTDVDVFLFGPDGTLIDSDADSGTTLNNFSMATRVAAGLHLLEVRGKTKAVRGYYDMFVNFVAGAEPDPEPPTEPTTPTEPDPEPVTDATGFLGNPPHNSTRSGIGIISGWVCEASNVTITITPVGQGGSPAQTFNIGYGADRPDTVGRCDHRSPDTGFGMAYNFNRLIEGQYRITARADEQQIGASRLFTVIYLDPDNTFLEDLEREVEVTDFPTTGETTTLEWEESLQNFVITDVQ